MSKYESTFAVFGLKSLASLTFCSTNDSMTSREWTSIVMIVITWASWSQNATWDKEDFRMGLNMAVGGIIWRFLACKLAKFAWRFPLCSIDFNILQQCNHWIARTTWTTRTSKTRTQLDPNWPSFEAPCPIPAARDGSACQCDHRWPGKCMEMRCGWRRFHKFWAWDFGGWDQFRYPTENPRNPKGGTQTHPKLRNSRGRLWGPDPFVVAHRSFASGLVSRKRSSFKEAI